MDTHSGGVKRKGRGIEDDGDSFGSSNSSKKANISNDGTEELAFQSLREAYPSINEASIRVVYQAGGKNFEIAFKALRGMLDDVQTRPNRSLPVSTPCPSSPNSPLDHAVLVHPATATTSSTILVSPAPPPQKRVAVPRISSFRTLSTRSFRQKLQATRPSQKSKAVSPPLPTSTNHEPECAAAPSNQSYPSSGYRTPLQDGLTSSQIPTAKGKASQHINNLPRLTSPLGQPPLVAQYNNEIPCGPMAGSVNSLSTQISKQISPVRVSQLSMAPPRQGSSNMPYSSPYERTILVKQPQLRTRYGVPNNARPGPRTTIQITPARATLTSSTLVPSNNIWSILKYKASLIDEKLRGICPMSLTYIRCNIKGRGGRCPYDIHLCPSFNKNGTCSNKGSCTFKHIRPSRIDHVQSRTCKPNLRANDNHLKYSVHSDTTPDMEERVKAEAIRLWLEKLGLGTWGRTRMRLKYSVRVNDLDTGSLANRSERCYDGDQREFTQAACIRS